MASLGRTGAGGGFRHRSTMSQLPCVRARVNLTVKAALPKHVDVAILGAGPCGLATAHALSKVLPPSSSIAVFEKSPCLTLPRGAGLGLEVNGLKALEAISPAVYNTIVSKHSTTMGAMEVKDHQGKPIKMLDTLARLMVNRQKYGMQEVQLGWHELVMTLAEMLPPQVQVFPGTRFQGYEEAGDTLTVHFDQVEDEAQGGAQAQAEARQAVTTSLLVAADGYFSKAREQCLGDGPPQHTGAVVWRARIEASEAERFGYSSGQAVNYVGPNRLLLIYKAGHGHVVWTASCTEVALKEAGINWQAVTEAACNDGDHLERTEAKGQASKERLLKVFGDFEAPVLDLFKATPSRTVLEHGVYLRPADDLRPDSFGRGRVVILGDAAHPLRPTGQGTNQAIEDALLLARYVQRGGGGFEQLDEFRKHRLRRLLPIAKHAETQGRIAYRADADRPVGAGVKVEPVSASMEEGLLPDYDAYVYEGEDFSPL